MPSTAVWPAARGESLPLRFPHVSIPGRLHPPVESAGGGQESSHALPLPPEMFCQEVLPCRPVNQFSSQSISLMKCPAKSIRPIRRRDAPPSGVAAIQLRRQTPAEVRKLQAGTECPAGRCFQVQNALRGGFQTIQGALEMKERLRSCHGSRHSF